MIGAAPAIFADRTRLTRLAEVRHDAEAETEAHSRLIGGEHQIVRRHQLDALARDVALAIQLAAAPEHLQEARIVFRRREQSRAAGKRNARSAGVMALADVSGTLHRSWVGSALDLPVLGR